MNNALHTTPRVSLSAESILQKVGNTPLVQIKKIPAHLTGVSIFAKIEWFNPGGSVKDRAAFRMIEWGERTSQLKPGKTILDATSGNTGISYALLGAAKGYKVKLALPDNASLERKRILKAYGAELILTDPREGSDGAIRKAKETYAENPQLYFFPDQYNNDENWMAHFEGTGPEIWKQTEGQVTHFVAGLGTSGTLMGTGRFLKKQNPDIQIISMEPDSPFHGLEGLKHMETSIVPGIYDPNLADQKRVVQTEDAYAMVKRLAREEGLLVGISSGAAMAAAVKLGEELEREAQRENAVIVTVFPDSGDKYLSDRFWDEDERGGADVSRGDGSPPGLESESTRGTPRAITRVKKS